MPGSFSGLISSLILLSFWAASDAFSTGPIAPTAFRRAVGHSKSISSGLWQAATPGLGWARGAGDRRLMGDVISSGLEMTSPHGDCLLGMSMSTSMKHQDTRRGAMAAGLISALVAAGNVRESVFLTPISCSALMSPD